MKLTNKRSVYKKTGFYVGMDGEEIIKARNTPEVIQLIKNIKYNIIKVFFNVLLICSNESMFF